MANQTTEMVSHNPYINLELMKKVMVFSEFILTNDYGDQFVHFLKELQYDEQFKECTDTIAVLISEYEISETNIYQAMSQLIKVPAFN
jgi:hypothetical protein